MTTVTKQATPGRKTATADGLEMPMYRQVVATRLFAERDSNLYTRTLMPGLAHLGFGEEIVAVGVCEAFNRTDYITSTQAESTPNREVVELIAAAARAEAPIPGKVGG